MLYIEIKPEIPVIFVKTWESRNIPPFWIQRRSERPSSLNDLDGEESIGSRLGLLGSLLGNLNILVFA